jgi:hypothetical protein
MFCGQIQNCNNDKNAVSLSVEYVSAYILPDATQEARGKYVCIRKHAYRLAGEGRRICDIFGGKCNEGGKCQRKGRKGEGSGGNLSERLKSV